MLKNKLTLYIYLLFICLLAGQIWLSSSRATDGDQLADLDSDLKRLVSENEQLKSRIYSFTSLENIQKFAQDTQMIPSSVSNLGSISVASRLGQP